MLYKDAVAQAMVDALAYDERVVIIGQNVTTQHGVFGTTTEAYRRFPGRVIEAPISETMLTGMCVGMAMEGYKPILVHTRADFSLFSFEHLINTAAKFQFLHGKPLPFIMRAVVGRGWGQGPVHSQSWHHMLAQVPGLRVFMPARAYSYRSYLDTALKGTSIIFEPRRLYEVESDDSALACLADQGYQNPDITIVTLGDLIVDAKEAIASLKTLGIRANYFPWEDLNRKPSFRHPSFLVDMGPQRPEPGLVAPPFTPLGVSQPYEESWYITANDIVQAACKLLGVEPPSVEGEHDRRSPVFTGSF